MKKKEFLVSVLLITASVLVFAETITLKTGENLFASDGSYLAPVDLNVLGSRCSITGIQKVDSNLWCISISALQTNTLSVPITYSYYVKKGDILKFRKNTDPLNVFSYLVDSISWNEAELLLQSPID